MQSIYVILCGQRVHQGTTMVAEGGDTSHGPEVVTQR